MNDLKSISEPIRIPTHSPLYGEVKTIGIWMSGGTDSSLLAYRLAEQLEDHDMGDIKLQPFCVRIPFMLKQYLSGSEVRDFQTSMR